VWNGLIDRCPALVARCADAASVQFGRQHALPIAVRGGGHSVAGHATNDGGLVIDLGALKEIQVDPQVRRARVSAEDSAYGGRQAHFLLAVEDNWHASAHDEDNIAWVRGMIAALRPNSDGGAYLNFPGFQEEGQALMQASFGPQYGRLAALKRKWDPDNVFRLNHNILPVTGG
jgi:FAD/FMN-containing dehydrogenase